MESNSIAPFYLMKKLDKRMTYISCGTVALIILMVVFMCAYGPPL